MTEHDLRYKKKKPKKRTFKLPKYKTHNGPRGNPDLWRETAKSVLHIGTDSCLAKLGLSDVPTESELKSAWRTAIKKSHPDVAGGSEDAAARINAAYETALNLYFSKPQINEKNEKRKDTGLRPQPLTPISEEDALKYLHDDSYCCQEKKDGKHIIIRKINSILTIANKQGLTTGIPMTVESSILALTNSNLVLDGELIGTIFYIFDLLEYENSDLRSCPYRIRLGTLNTLFKDTFESLAIVPAHIGTKNKTIFFNKTKTEGKEGIVFKKLESSFSPDLGTDMFKCKFWATLSAIVDEEKTGKSSFISYVLDEYNNRVYLGNCTSLGKVEPLAGDIVEIRYLYAYVGGKLIQPVLLGIRDDVSREDCTTKQLKFKKRMGMPPP